MIRLCLSLICLQVLTVVAAWAEPVKASLIFFKRETFESMLWSEERVRMGKESVNGVLEGLGAAGDSIIVYKVDGGWDALEAWIGYKGTAATGRTCLFEVVADGKTIYTSEEIKSGSPPEFIKVPIQGAQIIVLRIHPETYGSTAGAAWGSPMLVKGLRPEDLVPNLSVSVDGRHSSVVQPGGKAPKELPMSIPLQPGTHEYKVTVVYDKENHKATVTTTPSSP